MTLRQKVMLNLGLLFLGLLLLLFGTSRTILVNNFAQLEAQLSEQNVQRVLNVMLDSQESLQTLASDWAWWDETYTLASDDEPGDNEASLKTEIFAALRIDLILFTDANGQVIYADGYDLMTGQPEPPPRTTITYLVTAINAMPSETPPAVQSGYMMLPDGPALLVAAPILDGSPNQPTGGMMLWVRRLDVFEVQRLSNITRLPVTLYSYHDPNLPEDVRAARGLLSETAPTLSQPVDAQLIAGYALVNDITGSPLLILRVQRPRDIYTQGRTVILHHLMLIVGFGLLASLASAYLVNWTVLSRLITLTREVNEIGRRSDVSDRVSVQGEDELASLARTLNEMLDSLEHSQQELRRAQAQLAHNARLAAAGEVAAGVAHQINNPLTTIIAEVHLLLHSQELTDDTRESVEAIKEAAQRAGNIVEQLLDLARTVPYDMFETDVNVSLQNALTLVRAQVEPHVKRLAIELDPNLPTITASSRHLEDVVWINLLLNARDAVKGKENGQITVSTTFDAAEEMVEVTIADNGAGIKPEDLPNIFTPFFTTKRHGTGLGLAICRDVVTRHGGIITVNSEPGKGAQFTVRLPVTPRSDDQSGM